jgi:hypothetical protein
MPGNSADCNNHIDVGRTSAEAHGRRRCGTNQIIFTRGFIMTEIHHGRPVPGVKTQQQPDSLKSPNKSGGELDTADYLHGRLVKPAPSTVRK